ncbi:MAG TPA: class I SAM-dependent methyltransferase [Caulobacteraceae bacterium]|nr:class I SAM-dependent methyltransferase [Caulobacteraceae bacterium]
MASFYERRIFPWLINSACSGPSIEKQRAKVVPGATGRVLELGMGSALNLPFYDRTAVTRLDAVEPSDELRAMAHAKAVDCGLTADIVPGRAEAMPYDTASFDTVVCTFTLCSVQDPAAALAESRRVLKPSGRLIFCEHGLAPDPDVVKWQRRIEPMWKRLACGCHLTRPVATAIEAAGFKMIRTETMYLPGAPRWAGWNEWGAAAPA